MKNNSKLNTVLLMITVILLGVLLIMLFGKRNVGVMVQDKNVFSKTTENKKVPVVENEELQNSNPDYKGIRAVMDNAEIINKIVATYKKDSGLKIYGCSALPTKNGIIDYRYYVADDAPMLADKAIDLYETNGVKSGYCVMGGVLPDKVDSRCIDIESKMKSCKVVYDVPTVF
jgi:hypothetical protein